MKRILNDLVRGRYRSMMTVIMTLTQNVRIAAESIHISLVLVRILFISPDTGLGYKKLRIQNFQKKRTTLTLRRFFETFLQIDFPTLSSVCMGKGRR